MLPLFVILTLLDFANLVEIQVDSKDKREICADRMNLISSNIAIKAAEEAKAAVMAQYAAGCQASHRVKEQLAEKAIEAAKAAQAAAAGKAAIVDEIAREKEAVKVVIMELINSKARIEQAIQGQLRALQEDKSALKVLLAALHIARGTTTDADTVLRGIQDDLMEKEKVLQCALHRTNVLTREEECARQDMITTKCAARKAVQSAAEAKANAMRCKRMDEKKKP